MKADQTRLNRIPFMMSDSELEALDDWRFQNRIGTRAEAIRRLCQIGRSVGPMVTEAVVDIQAAAFDYTSLSEVIGTHGFDASQKAEAEFNEELLEAEAKLNESLSKAYLRVTSMKPIVDALSSGESFEAAEAKASDAAAKAIDIRARADQLREAMKNLPQKEGRD